MALTFKLDKIAADGKGNVAYVHLVDDAAPADLISQACIPYNGDESAFQSAIRSKFAAAITAHNAKASLATEVENILTKIDAEKIAAHK